jgi:DNA-binding NtrC family response regulator
MSPLSTRYEEPTRDDPLILVVDDEVEIRKMLRRVLELVGYRVYTVESYFHARHALSDLDDVACVVTDQRMSGPDGIALLDHCQRAYPTVGRVLFLAAVDPPVALASARHFVVEKTQPLRVLYDAIARAIRGESP